MPLNQSLKQHTIKNSISIEGIGLHSGKPVTLTLHPAKNNSGIIFRRTDLQPAKELPLSLEKIVETPLCTKLVDDGVTIQTIEHLLSALAGVELDNVFVDINSDELPIMDGSSAPFVFMIEAAGIIEQEAPRKFIKIMKTLRLTEEDKFVELKPYDHFQINLSIDFDHPAIKKTKQSVEFAFSRTAYVNDIARARTFGMADQLEQLHQRGLALGGSLDNAVGLSAEGILNPEGLRLRDEFVKHKLLDVIGDLYTVGALQGCFTGHKPSHALNHRLLETLMQDPEAWALVN
jgi:UDP-3-O-[3-hydroxymyristoyl] N-acetylglucosamine deacetylase